MWRRDTFIFDETLISIVKNVLIILIVNIVYFFIKTLLIIFVFLWRKRSKKFIRALFFYRFWLIHIQLVRWQASHPRTGFGLVYVIENTLLMFLSYHQVNKSKKMFDKLLVKQKFESFKKLIINWKIYFVNFKINI